MGIPSQQVGAMLFADRPATYELNDTGPEWTPESLLSRYNLELARGVLYWATQVQIEVHGSYKDLWKYLKLFKLMFWALPIDSADAKRSRESSVAESHFQAKRQTRWFSLMGRCKKIPHYCFRYPVGQKP